MNEVTCPRCLQVWFSEDDPVGSDRLCSGCAADLRAAGRQPDRSYGRGSIRKKIRPIDYFQIYCLVLAGVDVVMVALALIFPAQLGWVCLAYGVALVFLGAAVFRLMVWGTASFWGDPFGNIEWEQVKWPVFAAAAGVICIAVATRLVIWH
jgi:hypothetical protein